MSRIIVEKELNKKYQTTQQQTSSNTFYDILNPVNNQNSTPTPNLSVNVNVISNPPITQNNDQNNSQSQHILPKNLNLNQQSLPFTPIVQISPFKQIPPLSVHKNANIETDFQPPEKYHAPINIFGTEMTAQEADDLFENAEKLVGWSFWRIDE